MNQKIEISEIEIVPIRPQKSLVGFATCTFANSLHLGSLALHTDLLNKSFRIVYPVQKFANGKTIPLFYPINKITGAMIQEAIVREWNDLLNRSVCA